MSTFNLPDVGEGLTEAEIVSWKVQPGDTVAINQVFVEIETAKSLVELPSPFAGTVTELCAAEGQTLEVGQPLFVVAEAAPAPSGAAQPAPAPVRSHDTDPEPGILIDSHALVEGADAGAAPLVGSGPKADPVRRRPRLGRPPVVKAPAAKAPATATASAAPAAHSPAASGAAGAAAVVRSAGPAMASILNRVLAKPPVRKIAKELGIDLSKVRGTGGGGEVTREDLISYQAQREAEQAAAPTFWSHGEQEDRIERQPVKGVRKATAKAMVESAFTAPHVSIFVDVDASRTMEFVQRLKKSRDFEGIKVSPLLILAKAVIWAAARNPSVNASWVETENGAEIHVKHFMNLGIAAATPRGLLVPNLKNAQDLSLRELAIALNELATAAREGRTRPADMQNGTLTITNIGALGIDIGTPIINPGEVAIVAFGTIRQKPWVVSGEVIPRWITTLGGSFDHRVVDGDLSARFMADVAAIMEEPALLLD
ncbi:dihydrolipoamide acetyltransferase component of pyruvate dehydrogenase complex [Zafaria cholistanensis]|uniref:Dihydrolipoamide acetyltransferase component of pyruvate dehydrogenase complex n=1 Tax=Zafaria cholistanensis TaxID=1682741 RepID=A0A5A7NPI6_9MICC|nr:dihydrolipoamide acetyltransferase family protein [Zafaria cholistanensis]GER22710.1 dihydrolipoamide acetyltransferase component of pyruvate dehydrogenase complex [Zafaria cholistanensis]